MMRISRALLLITPLAMGCAANEPVELPELLDAEAPIEFPVELWDQGIEGEARVMVHVTSDGAVDTLYIEESSGYPEFDSAAIAGAENLRFRPGRRGDKRIDHWVVLPVRFTKEGAELVKASREQGS